MADYAMVFLFLSVGVFLGVVGMAMVFLAVRIFRIDQDERSRKRQTQSTDAGLLDMMADINSVEFNLEEIYGRLNTIARQVEIARGRAGIIRRGPYAYPKEGQGEVEGDGDEQRG